MKTQELLEADGKLTLRTVEEVVVEVTAEDVKKLDEAKAREILYLENDIRVLQARLAALQGEKAKTAEMHARAVELAPVKEEVKPLEGGAVLKP
jgi:hypothetical protein